MTHRAEVRAARWLRANPKTRAKEAPCHIRHTLNGTEEDVLATVIRRIRGRLNKYMPHQGKRECERRMNRMGGFLS